MLQNREVPRWGPAWFEPVQFETPSEMTGAYLDDDRGLLMWHTGGVVRQGFVDSPRQWAGNATCPSATTPFTVDYTVYGVSCWRAGGGLYCAVQHSSSTRDRLEIYVANSTSNPTSWSLHGTVQSLNLSNGNFYDPGDYTVGMPYIDGSNWVLPATTGESGFGNGHASTTAVFHSSDAGATWSLGTKFNSGGLGANDGGTTTHLSRDPSTGYLYGAFGYTGGSGLTWSWRESQDNGASWSTTSTYPRLTFSRAYPFMDDGTYMYGRRAGGSATDIVRFGPDPAGDAEDWEIVSTSGPSADGSGEFCHICDAGTGAGDLYLFNSYRVALLGGGWLVGRVGVG